jgi:hypothetical protein
VSHLEEREEKVCLNCHAQLNGRYCHVCGQENLEPKESFWHLLTHFVYDVTHFDGKFFSTLKYLLFKPGFLATEYAKGRRASYLHPIRMYVFASAIFFVVFFSFILKPEEIGDAVAKNGNKGLNEAKRELQDSINVTTDSAERSGFIAAYNAINNIADVKGKNGKDTVHKTSGATGLPADTYRYKYKGDTTKKHKTVHWSAKPKKDGGDDDDDSEDSVFENSNPWRINFNKEKLPPTVAEYDSIQKKLPKDQRDGWFNRMAKHRTIEINQKYHGDDKELAKNLIEKFLHAIPQMMFVSVPFVALILQLLYVRRRKQFYYVNHVIFIIYVYIAAFVSLLVSFGLDELYKVSKFAPFHWLDNIVIIYIFLYCLLAMHNFYKQGYVKSFFKYFLLIFICSFLSVFIVSIFFFTSLMSV